MANYPPHNYDYEVNPPRQSAGFLQGLGIGAGVISAPILLGGGAVLALVLLCCFCCLCTVALGAVADENGVSSSQSRRPTPTRVRAGVEFPPVAGEAPAAPAEPAAPVEPALVPEQSAGVVGQDIMVGEVRWKVLEAQDIGNTLQSDNQFVETKTTAGRFIRVRFEIENRGVEAKSFSDVEVIDAQGRTFEDYGDRHFFIEDSEACVFEQLNPNLPKTCTTIFEVPPDATNLKMKVGDLDLFGPAEAVIDLGVG